jgi:hypothetical protein
MTYSPPEIKREDCFYPNCDGYLAVPFCCKDPLALPALKKKLAQIKQAEGVKMSFKDLEQKHNLVNRVILACDKHPTDADINPLLEERLERFYEDAVIEGMAKQMHSSVDRAVNAMGKELAKPEQEPVGRFIYVVDSDAWVQDYSNTIGQPLYTAPSRKPWVGLTNDEINDFAAGCHLGKSVQSAICQAAAKLKEKNGAL